METSSLEEKRIENLRKRLETLATRIPVIMLQRIEETFPMLKNSLSMELSLDEDTQMLEDQLCSSYGMISVTNHIKIEGRKEKQNKDLRQSNSYNETDYNYNGCNDSREHEGGQQIHSCKFCHTVFSENIYLQKHVLNFSKKQWLKCRKCKMKIYCTKHDFIEHRLTCKEPDYNNDCNDYREHQADRRVHSCKFCHAVFLENIYLQTHLLNFSKKEWLKCRKCKVNIFCTKHDLIKHRLTCTETDYNNDCNGGKEHQDDRRAHSCRFCHKVFLEKVSLQKHLLNFNKKEWLKCRKCKVKIFSTKHDLIKHRLTCTETDYNDDCNGGKERQGNRRIHSCNFCHTVFLKKVCLQIHLRNFSKEEWLKCKRCKVKIYCTKHDLVKHQFTCKGESFKCDVCNKAFHVRSQLQNHLHVHSEERFTCDVCNKTLAWSYFKEHCSKHTREPKCNICKQNFNTEQELILHNFLHNGGPFTCKKCKKTFSRKLNLRAHLRIHNEKYFRCRSCNKSFNTESDLQSHRAVHKVKYVACDICNKSVSHKVLKSHKLRHVGKLLSCEICQETFSTQNGLKRHRYLHSDRSFMCDVCHKTFHRKDHLAQHCRIHTDDPIKCDVCNRVYETWCGLNDHRRIHTGEVFPCDICKKTFTSKYDLKLHLIFHRDGGFRCDECGKIYTNRSTLQTHKRIHSGEVLTCHLCTKNFTNKSGLRRHVKNVHKR